MTTTHQLSSLRICGYVGVPTPGYHGEVLPVFRIVGTHDYLLPPYMMGENNVTGGRVEQSDCIEYLDDLGYITLMRDIQTGARLDIPALPDHVFTIDPRGRVRYARRAA